MADNKSTTVESYTAILKEAKDMANFNTFNNVTTKKQDRRVTKEIPVRLDAGWVVAWAAFCLMFLSSIPNMSFGILFSRLLLDMDSSATLSAWIFNLAMTLAGLTSYLAGPLVAECGWRSVAFITTVFFAAGIMLSAYASSPWILLITYSLLSGPSIDFSYTIAYMVIPHYYTKRRNIANAIMASGASVSQMVMPPLITYLQEQFGVRGAALITGALVLNGCVAAMVLYPVQWHTKEDYNQSTPQTQWEEPKCPRKPLNPLSFLKQILKTAVQNICLLKSPSVIIISMILGMLTTSVFNGYSMVPFAMFESGYSQRDSSLCLSVAGVVNLAARLLTGSLAFCQGVRVSPLLLMGSTLAGVTLIVFNFVNSFVLKTLAISLCSVGHGVASSLYNLYAVEELGLPMLNTVISLASLMLGLFYFIMAPLTGLLHDMTQSYTASICLCGVCLLFTTALAVCLSCAKHFTHYKGTPQYMKLC